MTERKLIFLRRLGSSVALWVTALWIIFSGYEPGFLVLVGTLTLIGLWEFYRMLDHKKLANFKVIGMVCAGLFVAGSFYYLSRYDHEHAHDFELAALLLFHFVVFTRQMFQRTRDVSPIETMAFTLFGLLYVPWLFSFVTKIVYLLPRDAAGHVTGHFYVLWLIVVTKFSDMGAYITGSLIGRHLMVPHISPKKTWEGFGGALVFSAAGGCLILALFPMQLALLSYWHAIILGVGLGFAAVIGDLAESIIKRSAGVKDSGRLLPGIGGVLDLIDSILFTAPLMFFYLRFVLDVK
jgi:phosphatidate cytidylyltransferase